MGSSFMQQFLAGWRMGQDRNENARRDQEMQLRQQEEQRIAQERATRLALEQEEFAVRKKALAAEEAAHKLNAAKEAYSLQEKAQGLQNLPPPTAQDVGIQQMTPQDVGPTMDEINVPQPMFQMPNPQEGQPPIPIPILTGLQQRLMDEAKNREALGLLNAQEGIKAQYREKPKSLEDIQAEAAARARGTASVKPPPGEGGGPKLSQYSESNIINRLSNQWAAATKSSGEIGRQVSVMESGLSAARQGNLAAGSQAVLVTFQKILDPTSVVRESEYARSAAGQSLLSRMKGYVERLQKGGAGVPLSELEKYAEVARDLAKGQLGHVNATKERIGKVADRYGIPRELVLEDYDYGAALEAKGSTSPEFIRDPTTGKLRRK